MPYVKEISLKWKRRKAKDFEGLEIKSSNDAVKALQFLNKEIQERVIVLVLNSRNQLQGTHLVYIGSLNQCTFNPGDILRSVIFAGCPCFIVAHNHPSGDPSPSNDDIESYHDLQKVCKLVQIKMLDFIIIGDEKHYSFADEGRLSSIQPKNCET